MSRIGNKPINIPAGVSVTNDNNLVTVKGPKGELSQKIDASISIKIEDGTLVLSRVNDEKQTKAYHGLYKSLITNYVEGVSNGFKKNLELVGVGYKAALQDNILELNLGYSHPIFISVPNEIKATTQTDKGKNPIVFLESHDNELIGQFCAKIRSLRKIEPYKGKGIRFVGEKIRRKAGKTGSK